jgi:rod shape-determining protein MreD
MKPRFYIGVFLLLIPLQAGLLNHFSLGDIKPDLGLIVIFLVGLLTGPAEAALAGMGVGLLQDVGSAGILGLTGIAGGLAGLLAGMLGKKVLDIGSPSNALFLAGFSLLEGVVLALFLQLFYGSALFFRLLVVRVLPQALYTGLLGAAVLQILKSRKAVSWLTRRGVRKES